MFCESVPFFLQGKMLAFCQIMIRGLRLWKEKEEYGKLTAGDIDGI